MINRARRSVLTAAAVTIGTFVAAGTANAAMAAPGGAAAHRGTGAISGSPLALPSLGGSSSSSAPLIAGLDTPAGNEATAIQELGRTPALINGFYDFETGSGAPQAFPGGWAERVVGMGSTPEITWRPNLSDAPTRSVLTTISSGGEDAYISAWAQQAKALGHRIYVRLMHEFNGNWYPWGSVIAGQTPVPGASGTYPYTNTGSMYVAAFRHVVDIFRAVGATNVSFIWCAASGASTGQLASWYPGDAYVTWLGLDGYNKSVSAPRSVSAIFSKSYQDITAVSKRPVFIAETASVEYDDPSARPSSKAAWLTGGFLETVPKSFPRVIGVAYFDGPGAGFSYPFDSSQSSLAAIKKVFASPEYQASAS